MRFNKEILRGGGYLLLLQILVLSSIYISLPGYKKAYLLQRINLFLPVDSEYIEHFLFTVPESWTNGLSFTLVSPKDYIKKNRNLTKVSISAESFNDFYLQSLALENDKTSTLIEAEGYREKFQSKIDINSFIETMKASIGFIPIRTSNAYESEKKIFDRNNIPLPTLFKKGSLKNTFVIALHGRMSSPDALFGLTMDYSNMFGKYWNDAGFNVYALGIGSITTIPTNFPRLGLSEIGTDLAKIEDLSRFIKNKHGNDCHIVIVGISYGARLAEISALLFKDIDGLVSIGGSSRYDFLLSEFSMSFKNSTLNSDIWLNQNLSNLNIYKLILNKNKFLLSSTGLSDAGQYGDSGQSKFRMIKYFLSSVKDNRFRYVFFKGKHESNPQIEISEYMQLLHSNNIDIR